VSSKNIVRYYKRERTINRMTAQNIILGILVFILVVMVVRRIVKKKNVLTDITSAETVQKIEADDLDTSDSSSSTSNFTYSIWIYVNDWNYRFGEPKVIFGRTNDSTEKTPSPMMVLGKVENNVAVSLTLFADETSAADPHVVYTCGISNIPLQRWVHLVVSCYGRAMDLYMDGKLVRTCALPGVAKINVNAPVYITPNGGFSGWTSRFQYWAEASNPQKVANIYRQGYGGGMFGTMLGSYSVEINVKSGNETVKTISF